MNPLLLAFSHLSAAATGALVSAIWQGALLAAAILLCLRLFPALSAAARSVIWLNVFILLALLPLLPFFEHPAAPSQPSPGALTLDLRWSLAVFALWLLLSLTRAAQLILGALHLRTLARRATRIQPAPELQPLLRAPGGRSVLLCASDDVPRPSVLGFFRPRILVPPALLAGLDPAELRQVVIHEMEHLHRGDDWTNLLQKLALVLFPLNPALLWVERRLCAERELACDDSVLHSGSGRKAYALCLAHLAEFSLTRRAYSLILGAWERRPELVRRVHRILTQPACSMDRKPALAVSGTLIIAAFGCTLTLAHAPQIVHFVPSAQASSQAQALPPLDPADLARSLGGTPHLVKAVLPRAPQRPSDHAQSRRANTAVNRRSSQQLKALLADLETPPPQPSGALMVLTDWNDRLTQLPVPRTVVFTVAKVPPVRRVMFASAVYFVRTPAGWLVIRI